MTIPARPSIEPLDATSITLERVIAELRILGPSERLLALYELGLEGCVDHDAARVTTIVRELVASLDDDYVDVADGFRRVYEYCLQQAAEGQLDGVAFILEDLRDTLARALTDAAIETDATEI